MKSLKMQLSAYFLALGILCAGFCMCEQSPSLFELAFREDIQHFKRAGIESKQTSVESKVIFYLYTKNSEEEIITLDNNTLVKSGFDNKKETKIIIHGFFDNKNRPMPKNMKNKYLDQEDVNVIIVDWGKIAISLNYFKMVKEVPAIGYLLSELIQNLIAYGSSPKKMHLIGHSLGAHIAGYAGADVRQIYGDEGKLARITGLDPAKPLFSKADESHRLDKSDADFVDCIHTCGGLLGLYDPIGHVDFYPNGGKNIQPGCTFLDFGRCSHIRSHEYFTESIQPDHIFPALDCTGKECIQTTEKMGNPASNTARGILYAKTNRKAPFAPVII